MNRIEYPIAKDAVLYTDRPGEDTGSELWHVVDVYDPQSGGTPIVRMLDGTHTTLKSMPIFDVWDMFEPAGWQCHGKPTYIMTRKYGAEAYPKDYMSLEIYD